MACETFSTQSTQFKTTPSEEKRVQMTDTTRSLKGRSAIVTGGSYGLGLAVVKSLTDAGCKVGVIDREPFDASRVALSSSPAFIQADLARTTEVFAAVNSLADQLEGVDIVVNNAAIYPAYDLQMEDFGRIEEHFRSTYDVNVIGSARVVHAALPHLRKSGAGRIINFSSVSIYLGSPVYLESYIATKGAIVALTRVHAKVLGEFGITVNAIAPGSFPTRAEEGMTPEEEEAWNAVLMNGQVLQRRGRLAEVGELCAYLASPAAGFITGQCISIDGGWTFG